MNPDSIPWRTALVTLSATAIYAVAGPVPDALLLDKTANLSARPWTPLTTHLLHTDPGHLLADALGLLLVGLVFEPLLRGRTWLVLIAGAAAIDVAFVLAMPFERYCGLSGVINAVAGAGLIAAWRRGDRWALAFGALVAGKVLSEQFIGAGLLTPGSWPTAQQAHATGLAAGLVCAAVAAWPDRRRRSAQARRCEAPAQTR